ncbi:MAG: hypothetical protein ACRCWF_00305 [Beijerinckiaceae bacterium]
MRIRLSILAMVLCSFASGASAQTTDDLVGRWGVAAYWNAGDAAKTTAQARSFCNQPYVITKGPKGGAVMFEAFDGKRREYLIQSGQIVAADGADAKTTKTISSWTGQTLVFNYVEEEAKRKYGNMVFVKCGR